ncbi:hypothetical protein PVIIG_05600 [Plasmodium vivax India VII]|uniref:Uncharacterized protein n=1 Tax=Plasmodium vivax India VII TaxID=1077284 RepID=A0A0J9S3T3_PLAVI|nr:hypothetical protein PVIIG_05600 [Plasmodium vivax India VII]
MDIEKIPQQYPFLKSYWKFYKEYDESVTEGDEFYTFYDNKVQYHNVNKETYRDIFAKLLKNLKYTNEKFERTKDIVNCRYLYQWIYHTTKQLDNLEMIISILFQKFNEQDNPMGRIKKCPYYTYRTYNEDSENIIKLHICEDNIFNIRDILKDTKKENRCLGRKIIYECVNIYKKINAINLMINVHQMLKPKHQHRQKMKIKIDL